MTLTASSNSNLIGSSGIAIHKQRGTRAHELSFSPRGSGGVITISTDSNWLKSITSNDLFSQVINFPLGKVIEIEPPAKLIRETQQISGFTIEQLGLIYGVSRQTIHKWTKSKAIPSKDHLKLIQKTRDIAISLNSFSEIGEFSRSLFLNRLPQSPSINSLIAIENSMEKWSRYCKIDGVLSDRDINALPQAKSLSRNYSKWLRGEGGALYVQIGKTNYFPRSQFDERLQVNPVAKKINSIFRSESWDPFSIVFWTSSPSGWLKGKKPSSIWGDKEAQHLVIEAAIQDAKY